MTYLYRALNDFDILMHPMQNGIVNKETIEVCLRSLHYFLWNYPEDIVNVLKQYGIFASKSSYEKIYEELKVSYLFDSIPKIMEEVRSNEKMMHVFLHQFLYNNEVGVERDILLEKMSTLQNHLHFGSKRPTPWISFSKDLSSIKKYYLHQKKHALGICKSEIVSVFDVLDKEYRLAYDLSTEEKIMEVKDFLFNKSKNGYLYFHTLLNSVGFHYAISSREVVYYHAVPKERVIAVLSPLEVDLLLNGMLNLPVYETKEISIPLFYQILIRELKQKLIQKGEYNDVLDTLLEKHFREGVPLHDLCYEEEELIRSKKKVLALAPTISNGLVLPYLPEKIRVMEE